VSEKMPQTYANHPKLVPGFHYLLVGLIVANFLWAAWELYQAPSAATGRQLVVAAILFLISWYSRIFPLTVQDRVIRNEEKVRLAALLPADLAARVDELKRHQFVALRFAPDDELPGLVRRVLAGELKGGKEIKQAIKVWRPDYLRC
jgi:hypothetical protein